MSPAMQPVLKEANFIDQSPESIDFQAPTARIARLRKPRVRGMSIVSSVFFTRSAISVSPWTTRRRLKNSVSGSASRAASERHDSRTAAMPATQQMQVMASEKASEAIAPEISEVGSSQRQAANPTVVPNATMARNGTTDSRMKRERKRPRMRTIVAPPRSAQTVRMPIWRSASPETSTPISFSGSWTAAASCGSERMPITMSMSPARTSAKLTHSATSPDSP